MKLQEKQAVVDELQAKLTGSNAFYLTDFTGLNVKSITDLRRRLRNAGVEYLVVKNTMAERALEGSDLPDIAEFFRGPTAVVIGQNDPVTPAKVLADFAKEHDNRPAIKAGRDRLVVGAGLLRPARRRKGQRGKCGQMGGEPHRTIPPRRISSSSGMKGLTR